MQRLLRFAHRLCGVLPVLCFLLPGGFFAIESACAQDPASSRNALQAAVEALEQALADPLEQPPTPATLDALLDAYAGHLLNKPDLAGSLADAAGTIAVAEPEAAPDDAGRGGGLGRWISGVAALAPLVGTGLLLAGEDQAASGIALGSVSLAGIAGILNAAGARKEQAAAEAAAARREEAARLQTQAVTLHTILMVDLLSAAGTLNDIDADLVALRDGPAGTPQEGAAPAARFLAVLRSADAFYDAELRTLRSTLVGARTSPLLTEASHAALETAIGGIEAVRARWVAERGLYARAERASLDVLAQPH